MKRKILLVDDSATTLMMEKLILGEHTHYELHTARDGEEALTQALNNVPDLIVMDVVMPRKNGFQVCRELRQHEMTANVPVILVTSRGEEVNVEAGFEAGCNDYLTKPVNGQELLALVRGYLGN